MTAMNARAPIVALKDVRLADGPRMLFDGVDLALEPGVRACLVGRNGAGKSTLLRILVGRAEPDGGDRTIQPAARLRDPRGLVLRDRRHRPQALRSRGTEESQVLRFGRPPSFACHRHLAHASTATLDISESPEPVP